MFDNGSLEQRLASATSTALEKGALQPIPTDFEIVADQGVRFLIRVVAQLARKPTSSADRAGTNPFLPYDPDLLVAPLGSTHIGLLNKYNVVEHHLLIVTRSFVAQESPLNVTDFWALASCLSEVDGLGFYNAGEFAGASQPHKHLQLVPFPLAMDEPAFPFEPLFCQGTRSDGPFECASLPFRHALTPLSIDWFGDRQTAAAHCYDSYRELLSTTGIAWNPDILPPYNLMVTRQWMWLVPRSRESADSISLNSMAFAGALLVRNRQQFEHLRRVGPMNLLARVTYPRE